MVVVANPAVSHFHDPADAHASSSVNSPYLNPGSPSALANSCAEVNRSAGSFSRAQQTAASTFAGVDGLSLAGESGAPAMILPRTACAVPPEYGGSPTNIS